MIGENLRSMSCASCGETFHFARDQINVKCPHCLHIQESAVPKAQMTAADRQLLKDRQCGDKRRFASMEEADPVRIAYETQHLCEMNVYRCEFCGYLHIGHKPSEKRRRQDQVAALTAIPEIDSTLSVEEAQRERQMLALVVQEAQASLADLPPYDRTRTQVKRYMLANQTRLM